MTEHQRQDVDKDRRQDEAAKDSFPASDRPASIEMTGPGDGASGKPRRSPDQRRDGERPTGTPTSNRHATETAFVWEHEGTPPARR
jgi:hypothetical protein